MTTNPYDPANDPATNPESNSAPRKDYSKFLKQEGSQMVAADESKEISTMIIVKVSRAAH